jgi:protein-S-isoprenylcysteine O-methyltransferase Ste14
MSPGAAGDTANRGVLRPPLIYGVAIALGLLLQAAWPLELVSDARLPGAAAMLIAVALFLAAVRAMRRAGTPVPGDRPTTAIVCSGPYRFSRNPIYLAFSLLHLGIAGWVNSLWLLLTLVPAAALMSFVVIPREERYLQSRFPSEYSTYRAAVRRWL